MMGIPELIPNVEMDLVSLISVADDFADGYSPWRFRYFSRQEVSGLSGLIRQGSTSRIQSELRFTYRV